MKLTLIPLPDRPFPRPPDMPHWAAGSPEETVHMMKRLLDWAREVERWHEQVMPVLQQNVDRINQAEFAAPPLSLPPEPRIGGEPTASETQTFLSGSASPEVVNRVLAYRKL